MTHEFTVGEYQTRGGHTAVVLEKGPGGMLFGREQYVGDGPWYATRWNLEGTSTFCPGRFVSDLVPPVQTIWVAAWRDRGCATVQVRSCDNEEQAWRHVNTVNRIAVAVDGPYEVPI